MSSARQTVPILLLAAALCAGWALWVQILPRPELAETNYIANRLRIEHWFLDEPATHVIVGTSISGRLLPADFAGTSLASMANLGLDGANPDTGLALVQARPHPPAVVFLEVHRLMMAPGPNDQQLLNLAQGPGLAASRFVPLTRADWRPSTILYGWLKSRQKGGAGVATTEGVADSSTNRPAGPAPDPAWVERINRRIRDLQARGTRVILLRLPVGRENPAQAEADSFADEAARRLSLPLIDLFRLSTARGDTVTYTDGLHLTPSSATALAHLLATASMGQAR